ncbi:hypothetical protein EHP00_2116 [Ecytonucleospora hepatopenaei]|uniref:Secreted protein n=1 Tax=Ecytonucleospora hepatopenaei TaxID=646526 RepID=A0A1W0E4F0_9MICR|nr:hypothetical protein EHP00_2116 [Ecytonucleospora hepatopenaei]
MHWSNILLSNFVGVFLKKLLICTVMRKTANNDKTMLKPRLHLLKLCFKSTQYPCFFSYVSISKYPFVRENICVF